MVKVQVGNLRRVLYVISVSMCEDFAVVFNPRSTDTTVMEHGCSDCDRLLSEYEDSIKSHMQLLADTDRALDEQDTALLRKLEPLVLQATERRTKAREAVKSHEAIHSGEPSKSTEK